MRADKTTKITVMGHESRKIANLIGTLLDDHSRVSDEVCNRDTFCLFIAVSENHPVGDHSYEGSDRPKVLQPRWEPSAGR